VLVFSTLRRRISSSTSQKHEAMTTLKLPGMIDAHVHMREPGGAHKEGVTSGTAAALAGGVIGVLEMPNTNPATTDSQTFALKHEIYRSKSRCDFGLFLGSDGHNTDALATLGSRVAGLKLYLDTTYGDLCIRHPSLLEPIWERWPGPGPICIHAESSQSLSRAIALTDRYSQRLHVCHVSNAETLTSVLAAKDQGLPVTCEVTPHHLFFTSDDLDRLGTLAMMKPPLSSPRDQRMLWQHLKDVDCIATDHAPHTLDEKRGESPPPGVPGLETALPLLLDAVDRGRLDVSQLVELTYTGPIRIFPISAPPDTWVEVDPDARCQLRALRLQTRCGWTPFEGMWVTGRILKTWVRGRIAFDQGGIRATPGSGRDMVRSSTAAEIGSGGHT
jgi:dihydroorotase